MKRLKSKEVDILNSRVCQQFYWLIILTEIFEKTIALSKMCTGNRYLQPEQPCQYGDFPRKPVPVETVA